MNRSNCRNQKSQVGPTVLHVSPYMDKSAGGPPVVVEKLLEHASASGWTAKVATTSSHTADQGAALSDRENMFVFPAGGQLLLPAQRRQMSKIVQQADLIHCHTLWSPIVGLAARMAHKNAIPYLVSPHGMLDPYSLSQKAMKKQIYLNLIERRTLHQADCVLFTTREEKRLAEATLGPFKHTEIIGLGADAPDQYRSELAAAFLKKHPELSTKDLIVFCGRIHEKKRPEALVEALPRILETRPSAMLLFVGDGAPGLMTKLTKLAEELGVDQSVRFLGFLSGTDKWEALAASKLFALPSHQENFGIAAAEALRIGLPVLLTKRVNIWSEIVDHDAGIALDEVDIASSLATNILSLLLNSERLVDMSHKAKEFADANYTWSHSSQRSHDLYDRLLANEKMCSA